MTEYFIFVAYFRVVFANRVASTIILVQLFLKRALRNHEWCFFANFNDHKYIISYRFGK